jgi:hypothetical protein
LGAFKPNHISRMQDGPIDDAWPCPTWRLRSDIDEFSGSTTFNERI